MESIGYEESISEKISSKFLDLVESKLWIPFAGKGFV